MCQLNGVVNSSLAVGQLSQFLSTQLTELPEYLQDMAAAFLKVKKREDRWEKGGKRKKGQRARRGRKKRGKKRIKRRGGKREEAKNESYILLSPNLRRHTPSLLPHTYFLIYNLFSFIPEVKRSFCTSHIMLVCLSLLMLTLSCQRVMRVH